jgi:predicted metalloprotease with PDZ domain
MQVSLVFLIGVCPCSAAVESFTVVLRPCAADVTQHVPCVDVSLRLDGRAVGQGQPLFDMPLVNDNVETAAATLQELSASDAQGALQLGFHDDVDTANAPARHWHAARATVGEVVVHYRAPISQVLAPRGAAPPLELRSDHAAFSGQGASFLMLPEDDQLRPVSVHWDLSQMQDHAVAVTTLGLGDVSQRTMNASKILGAAYYMAGDVHVYPALPPPTGFFGAWYGNPPFDLRAVMESQQKLYRYYEAFFKRPSTAPYGVFMRENLVNAGGGVSLGSTSFVTTFGPKTELEDEKITLAHEMLHTFVGGLADDNSAWYAEGLAVYYERLLPLRAGQITRQEFLDDLNATAGRYYTDIMIHTPNSEIAKNFWADTRIRVLPYDRGSMYFAVLDGELRAASGGKESLDDLVLAMLDRERHNLPEDQAAWVALLQSHLGTKGKAEFEAMLGGAVMLPPSDAFGPCFARTTKPMRRYDLGFEPKVLTEPKRIVRGLVPGSAAAVAGIRNGDEITQPVPQDLIQAKQNAILTLKLLRDAKPLQISYLPRGETVEAYQWIEKSCTEAPSYQ